jgi:hypothetical protein
MYSRAILLAACMLAALVAPANAAEAANWGDDVQVMQDEELGDMRGGFAVGGYDINFGAVVTTYVDGTPALSTNVTWTDAGAIVNQTITTAGQDIASLTQAQRNALGIGGLDNASGVVITDASGVTALVHNLAEGALQNILVNTASGRDIAQSVDVTLSLSGFDAIQANLELQRIGLRLSDDMSINFGG